LFMALLVLLSTASVIGVRRYSALERKERDEHIAELEREVFPEYFESPLKEMTQQVFWPQYNWDKNSDGALLLNGRKQHPGYPLSIASATTYTSMVTRPEQLEMRPGAIWQIEPGNFSQIIYQ